MFTPLQRLDDKILPEPNSGCWLWEGRVIEERGGYGYAHYDKKDHLVHRLIYTLCVGPIPEGYEIDHKCFVRCCVNPAHLRPMERIAHHRMPNRDRLSDEEARRHHNENSRRYYKDRDVAERQEHHRRKMERRQLADSLDPTRLEKRREQGTEQMKAWREKRRQHYNEYMRLYKARKRIEKET